MAPEVGSKCYHYFIILATFNGHTPSIGWKKNCAPNIPEKIVVSNPLVIVSSLCLSYWEGKTQGTTKIIIIIIIMVITIIIIIIIIIIKNRL